MVIWDSGYQFIHIFIEGFMLKLALLLILLGFIGFSCINNDGDDENTNSSDDSSSESSGDGSSTSSSTNDITKGKFNLSGALNLTANLVNSGVKADYVYAVNTSEMKGPDWRKKSALAADGSFEMVLTKGEPWVMAFVDSSKVGAEMIVGIFKAKKLDSVSPRAFAASNSTNLGSLILNNDNTDYSLCLENLLNNNNDSAGNNNNNSDTSTCDDPTVVAEMLEANYSTFIGDLGMLEEEANRLGEMDDLMLRYINPDIDGNGIMDMDESDFPELSIRFWLTYDYGDAATMLEKMRTGVALPTDAKMVYFGQRPTLIIPKKGTGIFGAPPAKWSLHFSDTGGSKGYKEENPYVYDADNPGKGIVYNSSSDEYGLSIEYPQSIISAPRGTYTYKLYEKETDTTPTKTFTFTNIKTMPDARVTTNFVFPFPIFNADANGDITTINYTWMRKTEAGFVAASSADVEMMIGTNMASLKWYACEEENRADCEISFAIYPGFDKYATSGSFDLNNPSDVAWGIGASASKKRSDIRSIMIEFISKMGMKTVLSVRERE